MTWLEILLVSLVVIVGVCLAAVVVGRAIRHGQADEDACSRRQREAWDVRRRTVVRAFARNEGDDDAA